MTTSVAEAPVLGRATRGVRGGVLEWQTLISITLLVIFFIPMQRFTLGGGLPFELEPYRLLVALILVGWFTFLLIDPRVRLGTSGLGLPLSLFVAAVLGSIVVNADRIETLAIEGTVLKKLTYFCTFILMFLMIVSVVRTHAELDRIVRVLVLGGAGVAVTAVIEYWTHHNVYDVLPRILPVLEPVQTAGDGGGLRGGLHRTAASAEHPIALGAALVFLVPFAVYLAMTASRRWWFAAGLLALGTFTTVSRTSLLMLAMIGLVFLRLRPRDVFRMWPWAIPVLVAAQLAVPGSLGTFRDWLNKPSATVAEQKQGGDRKVGDQGRLADWGPSLAEFSETPVLGQGFGTRIPAFSSDHSAQILDNQWLKSLLETGLLGVVSLIWLLTRSIRRAARRSRTDSSAHGWLGVAFAASFASYAVSMFVYDAFSFSQATCLFFIVLALSGVAHRLANEEPAPSLRVVGESGSAPGRLAHARR